MSNFYAMTKIDDNRVPKSKFKEVKNSKFNEFKAALWIDNYFGRHHYGVFIIDDDRVRDGEDFIYNSRFRVMSTHIDAINEQYRELKHENRL